MGHGKEGRKRPGKIVGRFMHLTHRVMDSPAYLGLSAYGVKMLNDFARLYNGQNNGSLCGSMAKLKERGWNSRDMISKTRTELLNAGFLFQTVQGYRPNKASFFALTFHPLDRPTESPYGPDRYDAGVERGFVNHEYEKKSSTATR